MIYLPCILYFFVSASLALSDCSAFDGNSAPSKIYNGCFSPGQEGAVWVNSADVDAFDGWDSCRYDIYAVVGNYTIGNWTVQGSVTCDNPNPGQNGCGFTLESSSQQCVSESVGVDLNFVATILEFFNLGPSVDMQNGQSTCNTTTKTGSCDWGGTDCHSLCTAQPMFGMYGFSVLSCQGGQSDASSPAPSPSSPAPYVSSPAPYASSQAPYASSQAPYASSQGPYISSQAAFTTPSEWRTQIPTIWAYHTPGFMRTAANTTICIQDWETKVPLDQSLTYNCHGACGGGPTSCMNMEQPWPPAGDIASCNVQSLLNPIYPKDAPAGGAAGPDSDGGSSLNCLSKWEKFLGLGIVIAGIAVNL